MNQKTETIDIKLSSQEIEKKLLGNKKDFQSKKINSSEFKFISNRSVGTLSAGGFSVDPISINGKFNDFADNHTEITLSTKPRFKLKILITIYLVIV